MAKLRSTPLGQRLLLWVAPLVSVVLAPLFLHAAMQDVDAASDDRTPAVAALLLAVPGLSVLACLAQGVCTCPKSLPLAVLALQTLLLLGAFALGASPLRGWTGIAGTRGRGDPAGARGWRDAGDGYCEDAETRREFSSLHAVGITLEACAEAAGADPASVAFDHSAADGGCDVRYPAGIPPTQRRGYEWWGGGTGAGRATGSGRRKHGAAARCYARGPEAAVAAAPASRARARTAAPHPALHRLIQEYPFQPVRDQWGRLVNIILVRSPFRSRRQEQLFERYKDEILFLGICSFEDYPLPPPNPFSQPFPADKYVGLFPGFLHMFRRSEVFPPHVRLLLLSQSDFCLPPASKPLPKRYDFVFSGSDQDVDNDCVGWANYAKNWSFVKEALEVMCGELKMKGVLVATKDKANRRACSIPASCKGLITQTQYIPQEEFFTFVRQSHFLFVPQVHDASPRVATQALALGIPLLMNRNIMGGWKYVNEKTGEFFNDMSDFRESVRAVMQKSKAGGVYEPRRYVDESLGDAISGARLRRFVVENFQDRVRLPEGARLLLPSGA
mmetsp:Transcript_36754/g.114466  ORF Transcript_36754/g.114466 Transcript_36754/m.114466 type:complete len:559 (-) Transcript_36754:91-1767(-)